MQRARRHAPIPEQRRSFIQMVDTDGNRVMAHLVSDFGQFSLVKIGSSNPMLAIAKNDQILLKTRWVEAKTLLARKPHLLWVSVDGKLFGVFNLKTMKLAVPMKWQEYYDVTDGQFLILNTYPSRQGEKYGKRVLISTASGQMICPIFDDLVETDGGKYLILKKGDQASVLCCRNRKILEPIRSFATGKVE